MDADNLYSKSTQRWDSQPDSPEAKREWELIQTLAGDKDGYRFLNITYDDSDQDKKHPYVEVVHDILLTTWTTLRTELDRNIPFFIWNKETKNNAKAWLENGKDQKYLLSGGSLTKAEDYLNSARILDADIIDFIKSGRAASDAIEYSRRKEKDRLESVQQEMERSKALQIEKERTDREKEKERQIKRLKIYAAISVFIFIIFSVVIKILSDSLDSSEVNKNRYIIKDARAAILDGAYRESALFAMEVLENEEKKSNDLQDFLLFPKYISDSVQILYMLQGEHVPTKKFDVKPYFSKFSGNFEFTYHKDGDLLAISNKNEVVLLRLTTEISLLKKWSIDSYADKIVFSPDGKSVIVFSELSRMKSGYIRYHKYDIDAGSIKSGRLYLQSCDDCSIEFEFYSDQILLGHTKSKENNLSFINLSDKGLQIIRNISGCNQYAKYYEKSVIYCSAGALVAGIDMKKISSQSVTKNKRNLKFQEDIIDSEELFSKYRKLPLIKGKKVTFSKVSKNGKYIVAQLEHHELVIIPYKEQENFKDIVSLVLPPYFYDYPEDVLDETLQIDVRMRDDIGRILIHTKMGLYLFDILTGNVVAEFERVDEHYQSVSFLDSNNDYLAIEKKDGTSILSIETLSEVSGDIPLTYLKPSSLRKNKNIYLVNKTDKIITSDDKSYLYILDRINYPNGSYKVTSSPPVAMSFSPDGREFFSIDITGMITVYDLQKGKIKLIFPNLQGAEGVLGIISSPDKEKILVYTKKYVSIYHAKTGKLLWYNDLLNHEKREKILKIGFSDDGSSIIVFTEFGYDIPWLYNSYRRGAYTYQARVDLPSANMLGWREDQSLLYEYLNEKSLSARVLELSRMDFYMYSSEQFQFLKEGYSELLSSIWFSYTYNYIIENRSISTSNGEYTLSLKDSETDTPCEIWTDILYLSNVHSGNSCRLFLTNNTNKKESLLIEEYLPNTGAFYGLSADNRIFKLVNSSEPFSWEIQQIEANPGLLKNTITEAEFNFYHPQPMLSHDLKKGLAYNQNSVLWFNVGVIPSIDLENDEIIKYKDKIKIYWMDFLKQNETIYRPHIGVALSNNRESIAIGTNEGIAVSFLETTPFKGLIDYYNSLGILEFTEEERKQYILD